MKNKSKPFSDDITQEYIARLKFREDELGSIIKGHLLIEFIINRIIERKCKNPQKILDDHRSYPFAVKLQIVYSMNLLPDHIYKNVSRINKVRNQLAHNLEVKIGDLDFKYVKDNGKEMTIEMPKSKHFPERNYIQLLCMGTLNQLRNHYFLLFAEFPKYNSVA